MQQDSTGFQVIKTKAKNVQALKVGWQSPSNIALVKYWGKRPGQIPENPSISLTLSKSFTETFCTFKKKDEEDVKIKLSYFFEGRENPAFGSRIESWLEGIKKRYPFLMGYNMTFESRNSFPHSAGIASSASAMSAIAMCITELSDELFQADNDRLINASNLARLGSGSACRSVYPHAALWGKMKGGYDTHAVPMSDDIDPIFHTFQDSILIVDNTPKAVSSSVGHGLMKDNIFAKSRYAQANKNMVEILAAMKTGDLEKTGAIIEEEALTLHAMMMLSNYMLLKPGSLAIIEAIRNIRASEKWPIYFTIDAGPNIHLLYPANIKEEVKTFIDEELKLHCMNGQVIFDEVGEGPIKLK